MIKKLIVWEKWIDPFGKDTDEAKWMDYENNLNPFTNNEEDDDYDEEDEQDTPRPSIKIPNAPVKVIASPLGLIPYNEHTASSKIFNFWLGHTNFNISSRIKEIIENIDGVEILDVFTRYRFRIAIGKCFDDAEVMTDINNAINKLYENANNKQ